jgi:dipeptidyl aminopeptidase/acylaminoacyl peptidase
VVVRARRPASVIAVVALLVGLVFAGPPAATAQDPPAPIPPYRIGYVSQDGTGEDRDIWSANAAGQDRTDVTNRPRLDETHPAYSPDGTRLAYTEQGADGSLRVIVADADGLNPRPLTDPEPDLQGDPTWSPDGTMIAFTNVVDQDGFEVQSIRIVRVADGRPLGDIPMPAHLQGKDLQPAWSRREPDRPGPQRRPADPAGRTVHTGRGRGPRRIILGAGGAANPDRSRPSGDRLLDRQLRFDGRCSQCGEDPAR